MRFWFGLVWLVGVLRRVGEQTDRWSLLPRVIFLGFGASLCGCVFGLFWDRTMNNRCGIILRHRVQQVSDTNRRLQSLFVIQIIVSVPGTIVQATKSLSVDVFMQVCVLSLSVIVCRCWFRTDGVGGWNVNRIVVCRLLLPLSHTHTHSLSLSL